MKIYCFLFPLVFLGTFLSPGADGGSLLTTMPQTHKKPACCKGEGLLSCVQMDIDESLLGDDELILEPLNATLKYIGSVGGGKNSFHYANEDVEFTVTLNKKTLGAHGHAAHDDGRSFALEYCGVGVHVFKEFNEDFMLKKLEQDDANKSVGSLKRRKKSLKSYDSKSFDTTTIITYTVKVYYTKEFADSTADVEGEVDQMINDANLGYEQSKVPIRVKLHALERATIPEVKDNSTIMLNNFNLMKGTVEELRGTADTATLLVSDGVSYGGRVSEIDATATGKTTSVCAKWFIQNLHTFAHEEGHAIGLGHNREAHGGYVNSKFSDGHGHLIAKGSASTGYRSILAYPASGHNERVNYYSNPNVKYPKTGTATGVNGVSNNARVLTAQRFKIAAVGDESSKCVVDNHWTQLQSQWKGYLSPSTCKSRCQQGSDWFCVSWYTKKSFSYSWYYGYRYRYSCVHVRMARWRNYDYATGPGTSCADKSMRKDSECNMNYRFSYPKNTGSESKDSAVNCHRACKAKADCSHWDFHKKEKKCYYKHAAYAGWSWYYRSGSGYFC